MAEQDQPVTDETPEARGGINLPAGQGGAHRKSVDKVELAERRARALDLRKAGHTFDAIARDLGCSISNARKLVSRGLYLTIAGPAAELRQLEGERLDSIHALLWQRLHRPAQGHRDPGPDLKAIDRLLRISAQRAALWGLNTPTTVKVELPGATPTVLDALGAAEAALAEALASPAPDESPDESPTPAES